jgi:hypothetical protein
MAGSVHAFVFRNLVNIPLCNFFLNIFIREVEDNKLSNRSTQKISQLLLPQHDLKLPMQKHYNTVLNQSDVQNSELFLTNWAAEYCVADPVSWPSVK